MRIKPVLWTWFMWVLVVLALAACQDPASKDLSKPGKYQAGVIEEVDFKDPARNDRAVRVRIWYPASHPKGTEAEEVEDAEPDRSGAPYAVIVMSTEAGRIFAPHLATHGFVVIGLDYMGPRPYWGEWLIDYPLDQAFALEQVVAEPPEFLAGMINGEQAGAAGYSFDGYNALALAGARVNPRYYLDTCAAAKPVYPYPEKWWVDYICKVEAKWEEFEAHAGESLTGGGEGLWQPMTSPLVKAAMPMGPEGAWLFGAEGLAAVDIPVLILVGTGDLINYYDLEAKFIFNHMGSEQKTIISFLAQDHYMVFEDDIVAVMKHLMTAFFGYHLQWNEDYAILLSEEVINAQEGLQWGVVELGLVD